MNIFRVRFSILTLLILLFHHSGLAQQRLLIQNVSIISPEREEVIDGGFVLIEEDKILAAGSDLPDNLTGTETILDGSGKFIIPGLIDAHVHLTDIQGMNLSGGDPDHLTLYPELVAAFKPPSPGPFLKSPMNPRK